MDPPRLTGPDQVLPATRRYSTVPSVPRYTTSVLAEPGATAAAGEDVATFPDGAGAAAAAPPPAKPPATTPAVISAAVPATVARILDMPFSLAAEAGADRPRRLHDAAVRGSVVLAPGGVSERAIPTVGSACGPRGVRCRIGRHHHRWKESHAADRKSVV